MEGYRHTIEHQVIFHDLDLLGHVNNVVYAVYAETGRLEYLHTLFGQGGLMGGIIVAEITLSYKSPAFLREQLVIGTRIAEIGNSSFVMETQVEEKTTGRLVCTARAILVRYDYEAKKAVPVPGEWREVIGRYEGRTF